MTGDMRCISQGFTILSRYDDASGEVSADHDQIWAGSQQLEYADYTIADRDNLESLGWEFDTDISRWSYGL